MFIAFQIIISVEGLLYSRNHGVLETYISHFHFILKIERYQPASILMRTFEFATKLVCENSDPLSSPLTGVECYLREYHLSKLSGWREEQAKSIQNFYDANT